MRPAELDPENTPAGRWGGEDVLPAGCLHTPGRPVFGAPRG